MATIDWRNTERAGFSDRANFDHLGMSLITLFRVLTGDNWALLLADCMRGDPVRAAVAVFFFVTLVIFNFLLINLLNAALLLGGFNALIRATFTSQLGSTPGRTPGRMSTGRSSVSSSSGEGFGLQVV